MKLGEITIFYALLRIKYGKSMRNSQKNNDNNAFF